MNTINKNLTFTNREEYVSYRTKWKLEYNELSQKIRDIKFLNWYSSVSNPLKQSPALNEKWNKLNEKYKARNQWEIFRLKLDATSRLKELKEAKLLAQEQYLKTP